MSFDNDVPLDKASLSTASLVLQPVVKTKSGNIIQLDELSNKEALSRTWLFPTSMIAMFSFHSRLHLL